MGGEEGEGGPGCVGAHDGEDHGGEAVGEVCRPGVDGDGEEEGGEGDGEVSEEEEVLGRDARQQRRDDGGDDSTRDPCREKPERRLQRGELLVILEVKGSVDEEIIKGGEEEAHDDKGGGELCVLEDGDFH